MIQTHIESTQPIPDPRETSLHINTVPWEAQGIADEGRDLVEGYYHNLLENEDREAYADDLIYIFAVEASDTEYRQLIDSGVLEDGDIDANGVIARLKRSQLLAAGFCFNNHLAGGEKSIINGTFSDPDDPTTSLDFTDRKLLTRDELDKVYRFQQKNPDEYGLQGHTVEEIRQDIATLLLYCVAERGTFSSQKSLRNNAVPTEANHPIWQVGDVQDRQRAAQYFEQKIQALMDAAGQSANEPLSRQDARHAVQAEFLEREIMAEGAVGHNFVVTEGVQRNGISISDYYSRVRMGKLQGVPSPFLDRGFVFSDNPDVVVQAFSENNPNIKEPYRLNIVNFHLMGGHPDYPGFSEMGQKDWDQHYIPVGIYVRRLYPPAGSADSVWCREINVHNTKMDRDQAIIATQKRLIAVAAQAVSEQAHAVEVTRSEADRQGLAAKVATMLRVDGPKE